MDQIHCYLLHSFDTGYRLTTKEKNVLLNDENNCNQYDDINVKFNNMNKILNGKRNRFNNIFNRTRHSKFVTIVETKNNQQEFETEYLSDNQQQNKRRAYSFSHRFNYWEKNKELSVSPKYSSLKHELTSPNNICFVSINEWIQTENKVA
eukprot:146449_1